MSHFFASCGQSTWVSASASVLPVNIQDWFPLGGDIPPNYCFVSVLIPSILSFSLILYFKLRICYDSICYPLLNYYLFFCITFFNECSRAGVDKPWPGTAKCLCRLNYTETEPCPFVSVLRLLSHYKVEREIIMLYEFKYTYMTLSFKKVSPDPYSRPILHT